MRGLSPYKYQFSQPRRKTEYNLDSHSFCVKRCAIPPTASTSDGGMPHPPILFYIADHKYPLLNARRLPDLITIVILLDAVTVLLLTCLLKCLNQVILNVRWPRRRLNPLVSHLILLLPSDFSLKILLRTSQLRFLSPK